MQYEVDLCALHLCQLLACLQHLCLSPHCEQQEGMVGEIRLPGQSFWTEPHCPQTIHPYKCTQYSRYAQYHKADFHEDSLADIE